LKAGCRSVSPWICDEHQEQKDVMANDRDSDVDEEGIEEMRKEMGGVA